MSTTKAVSGYLVDKVSGAMVLGKGVELGAAGITFSDGSVQTTAATIGATQTFNFSPPAPDGFVVEGGTPTVMNSTETAVTGGLAIVSFNITTLSVVSLTNTAFTSPITTLVNPAVLQLTLTPNGSSTEIFERSLTFVSQSQTGDAYNGAAIVSVPAGTTGLTVTGELYDTKGTSGAALQVKLVPRIRIDYVPF